MSHDVIAAKETTTVQHAVRPLTAERETGIEPATTALEGQSSTVELLPRCGYLTLYGAFLTASSIFVVFWRCSAHDVQRHHFLPSHMCQCGLETAILQITHRISLPPFRPAPTTDHPA
jgi:hypothetical protein